MRRLWVAFIVLAGCARHLPATRPLAPDTVRFQSQAARMRFAYPASWHPVRGDTVLTLIPGAEAKLGQHHVVVEKPDLPWHIPNLIPIRLVESGFVDDLKKRYKQLTVSQSVDHAIADAAGREVHATGIGAQGTVVIVALLCVHGDAVYIVDAETDPSGASAAQAAFDTVVDSIQWMD